MNNKIKIATKTDVIIKFIVLLAYTISIV